MIGKNKQKRKKSAKNQTAIEFLGIDISNTRKCEHDPSCIDVDLTVLLQFFDDELPDVCNKLANRGIRVVIAGLDMDYLGNPFGPMPALMSIAELVTKVHAVCLQCGGPASYSFRTSSSDAKILLGEKESYEPRCRTCYKSIG